MLDNETNWLSPRLRAPVIRFASALVVLGSWRPRMTTQLAQTFLAVAADEGLTVGALATKCGFSPTMACRHVQELSHTNRHRKPGLGLVATAQRVHGDRREIRIYLTEHGMAVFRQMKAACLTGPTWRIMPDDHDWYSDRE